VDYDQSHMPNRTGRARASVKARSSQRAARVAVGGSKAPYVPWLDFGGEGRRKGRPPARPFLKAGRYTYVGLKIHRDDITEIMSAGLTELARSGGLDVT
jgi:phage gpG-like protein